MRRHIALRLLLSLSVAIAAAAQSEPGPIVVDGRIILPEGDANSRATTGVLDIWSLPTE